ncbi:MAG: dihydroneopterin aldolase [Ignavibacteriae bacterium]|nr:dihydroneopterin aldolase [Ignavibacteriota bacterium]MCB0723989.1 dihydroneopterin aldolase [Ignavibacteriota bacterium]MCB9243967.1 dihydroneopterin aldolase [Ignavibacteriales bacterium]
MTTIRINNAKFFAFHGVLEYERKYGNQFEIDIEMECDIDGISDDLNETVDYLSVYNEVKKNFESRTSNLIETANREIGELILEKFPKVMKVKVSIRKPDAPLGIIDSVEIEKTYERN